MATSKIKKGDTVRVIAGKDKGREGKVSSVKNGKVVVEGINQVTKHAKPSQANPQGKASRVGFKIEDGKKVRYAKATGEVID